MCIRDSLHRGKMILDFGVGGDISISLEPRILPASSRSASFFFSSAILGGGGGKLRGRSGQNR
eukprot:4040786-Pyramimonas_sp.AAC.1